jgi:hypothetical protein
MLPRWAASFGSRCRMSALRGIISGSLDESPARTGADSAHPDLHTALVGRHHSVALLPRERDEAVPHHLGPRYMVNFKPN